MARLEVMDLSELQRYEDNITIKNNNIGGYTSNVVIHGQRNNLVFENNNFFGELNTSSGQRNVTIENGNSDIIGITVGKRVLMVVYCQLK